MRVRAFVGAFVCAAAAAVAVPLGAGAAQTHTDCATFDNQGNIINVVPNCSETITTGAQPPQSQPGVNPCNGDTGTLTMSIMHSIFHVNVNGAGDVWVTGTQNGDMTFTPDDASEPSGAGRTTMWFGGEMNNKSAVFHDTFSATLRTTDGHTVTVHGVDHTTITGTGTVTSDFSFGNTPICH